MVSSSPSPGSPPCCAAEEAAGGGGTPGGGWYRRPSAGLGGGSGVGGEGKGGEEEIWMGGTGGVAKGDVIDDAGPADGDDDDAPVVFVDTRAGLRNGFLDDIVDIAEANVNVVG